MVWVHLLLWKDSLSKVLSLSAFSLRYDTYKILPIKFKSEFKKPVIFIWPFSSSYYLLDNKHGWKNAILQKWWSLLVPWSLNTRYLVRFASSDCTFLLNYSRGEHSLHGDLFFHLSLNSFSRFVFIWLAWMSWSYFSLSLNIILYTCCIRGS